ncbi:hypothetical protein CYMTET_23317 [Cymbomonas tetramitiformis]|uniref:Uncharacterized protein n=1 Tax=Cymbomonas tetramitiformis TaxID=36881 RepID=A0AAE0FYH3_9CHLO|nr:hypothetical protein CYMTET_23317 [Cymbomonas tetramitiformis]
MDAASGRPLEWLAVLPTHHSETENRYYNRLVGSAKQFNFGPASSPPMSVAFADDYEESEEEEEATAVTATPPRVQHPEVARKHELRQALLSSIRKPKRMGSATTSEAGDSQQARDQEPSPVRELPFKFANLTVRPVEPEVAPVGKYVPPPLQALQPLARAANPLASRSSAQLDAAVRAAAAIPLPPEGGAPGDTAGAFGGEVRDLENADVRDTLASEVRNSVQAPHQHQGKPSYEHLVRLKTPVPDTASYVSGAIDGATLDDPYSPSHLGWERYVNYSGNSISRYRKAQMMRLIFAHTLGESSAFEHTPLRQSVADLVQDGTTIRVKDNVQFPTYERFITCHMHFDFLYRSATLVITRLEFMLETVKYMRSEWPTLRFEAAYYITTRWAKQPYSGTIREDRDLLLLGADEAWATARRDNLCQYVLEYFPHMAFQRLLTRLSWQLPPETGIPTTLSSSGLVPTLGSSTPAAAPATSSAAASSAEGTSGSTRPAGPHSCPLCGKDHLYRVGFYEHTGPITKPCNKVKVFPDGTKKRCVKKHAFTGPLGSSCEFTS